MKLKDNLTGGKALIDTEFSIKINDGLVEAKFVAQGSSLISAYDTDNSNLYEGNVVEIFFASCKDLNIYYELEVAPNGKTFFALIDNHNGDKKRTYLTNPCKVNVTKYDSEYHVLISVKAELLGFFDMGEMFINAYRVELLEGRQCLFAVSPTYCDSFHKSSSFVLMNTLVNNVEKNR